MLRYVLQTTGGNAKVEELTVCSMPKRLRAFSDWRKRRFEI